MNDRTTAMSILVQARDLLTDRLIESVLESENEILEDANGDSYVSEIEAIQERIGGRLNSVNVMIGNLGEGESDDQGDELATKIKFVDDQKDAGLADDASDGMSESEEAPAQTNFILFVDQIVGGNLSGAGETIAELLDLDPIQGGRCAVAFQNQYRKDPRIIQKAQKLRTQLKTNGNNESLKTLWDCFGLQGTLAVEVLHTLKARFATA